MAGIWICGKYFLITVFKNWQLSKKADIVVKYFLKMLEVTVSIQMSFKY